MSIKLKVKNGSLSLAELKRKLKQNHNEENKFWAMNEKTARKYFDTNYGSDFAIDGDYDSYFTNRANDLFFRYNPNLTWEEKHSIFLDAI